MGTTGADEKVGREGAVGALAAGDTDDAEGLKDEGVIPGEIIQGEWLTV